MGKRTIGPPSGPVSLKTLAAHLKLDPTTVSVVLNEVPGRSIPEATRERIRKAALKFNYQPSFLARSLRNRRTMTIGILVPVLADGYHAEVMTGIGDSLLEEKYFYFIAHHRHRADLIEQYPRMLISRGAEGLITIDTNLVDNLPPPVVAIAGHRRMSGVTNVVLDNHRAAELSLRHLYDLGHRTIAFMRGQPYSSDSNARWQGIVQVAQDLGLVIHPELTIQLKKDLTSPELGYPVVKQLLTHHRDFTAFLSYTSGIARGTTPYVGWGDAFFDLDNDGWPDLIMVNGHVYPQVDTKDIGTTFREPKRLYLNQHDGTFRDISKLAGPAIQIPQVSRGLAVGDLFNDGRLEMVIENLEGEPMILQTQGGPRNHWVSFELQGATGNRLALNARLRATAGDLVQEDQVQSGGSYLSQSDLRIHFGLSQHEKVDRLEIFWPSGKVETLTNLGTDHFYLLKEGEGALPARNSATGPPRSPGGGF